MKLGKLHITKAHLEKTTEYRVYLDFEVNHHTYSMCVIKGKQGFFPMEIFHGRGETCVLCNHETYHCPGIEKYMPSLFQQLIQHSSIRLDWLFLDHSKKHEGDQK